LEILRELAIKPLKIKRYENISTVLKLLHAERRIGRGIRVEVQRGVFGTLIYTGAKILRQKLSFTLLEGIQGGSTGVAPLIRSLDT